jgi:NAD(P)-dependent dehydrogenase (short-subunit alcohol dehydrogenase family)
MTASLDFSGQTVLITGASRGIGLAVAQAFAGCGARLILIALEECGDDICSELRRLGAPRVDAFACDIADREAVRCVFSTVETIDVLVNNAGLELLTPIEAQDDAVEAAFRRIIDINVMGTFYVTREALPKMRSGARILITASQWGKTAAAGFSAYCASKHANIGFMRALAKELGPRGIAVNAVCPGFTRTQASMRSVADEAARMGLSEEEVVREFLRGQAFEGLMEPHNIAPTYLFLASDLARDITGQTLHVDRGSFMD